MCPALVGLASSEPVGASADVVGYGGCCAGHVPTVQSRFAALSVKLRVPIVAVNAVGCCQRVDRLQAARVFWYDKPPL